MYAYLIHTHLPTSVASYLIYADVRTFRRRVIITHQAEIDMPGHSTALLKAIPSLAAHNLKTGKPCSQINVTDSNAIAILQTLVGEALALFPGRWHHLGADEVNFDADCGMTKSTYMKSSANPLRFWSTRGHLRGGPTPFSVRDSKLSHAY